MRAIADTRTDAQVPSVSTYRHVSTCNINSQVPSPTPCLLQHIQSTSASLLPCNCAAQRLNQAHVDINRHIGRQHCYREPLQKPRRSLYNKLLQDLHHPQSVSTRVMPLKIIHLHDTPTYVFQGRQSVHLYSASADTQRWTAEANINPLAGSSSDQYESRQSPTCIPGGHGKTHGR